MKKDRAFLTVPSLIRRRNLGSGQMSLGFLALLAKHTLAPQRALRLVWIEDGCDANMAQIVDSKSINKPSGSTLEFIGVKIDWG